MTTDEVCLLINDQDSICCLAGAGISMDAPSCCISGLQAVEFILKELTPNDEVFQNLKHAAFPVSFPTATPVLRFEHLIIVIQNAIDATLSFIYELFDDKLPNYHHFLMATLINGGHTVITTNFDMNIEKALDHSNFGYAVAGIDEWEVNTAKQGLLGKIHGSLYHNGLKSYFSLQATVRSILSGSADQLTSVISPERGISFFRTQLKEKFLLVIGYSGFDDFDLVPAMISTPSEQCVVWIKHSVSSYFEIDTFETLNLRYEQANCFSAKSDEILYHMVTSGSRRPECVFQITGPTNEILHKIFGFEKDLSLQSAGKSWPKSFRLGINDRWLASANIYLQLGDCKQAYDAFVETAATSAPDDFFNQHRSHYNAADCALALKDYSLALFHNQEAGRFSDALNDTYRSMLTLYMKSRILFLNGTNVDKKSALEGFAAVRKYIENCINEIENRIEIDQQHTGEDINLLKNYRELFASCAFNELRIIAKLTDWNGCKLDDFIWLANYCDRFALSKYEIFTAMDILYLKKRRGLLTDKQLNAGKKDIISLINQYDLSMKDDLLNEINLI